MKNVIHFLVMLIFSSVSYAGTQENESKSRKQLADILTDTFALHKKMQSDPNYVSEAKIDFRQNLRNDAFTEMLKSGT